MDEASRQPILDEEHLRLLRLGFFISAGMAGFMGVFGLLYAGMGFFMGAMMDSMPSSPAPPPRQIGMLFGLFGLFFSAVGGTICVLRLRAAKCLRERRSHTFCQVMAAFSCIEIPYGTAFGVFALAVLGRPSVRRLFEPR